MAPAYEFPAGGIMQASLRYRVFGQQCLMIRHYWLPPDASFGLADGPLAVKEFGIEWDRPIDGITEKLKPYCTTEVTFEEIRTQLIDPVRWAYVSKEPVNPEGTQPPPTMPQNTTIVATMQSDSAGRVGRGNVYITGWEASCLEGGYVTGLAQSHAQVVADFLLENVTVPTSGGVFEPIIYHRANFTLSKKITHSVVQEQARTMRRRTVGRGI